VAFDQEADLCFSQKGLKAGQSSLRIPFSFVLILFFSFFGGFSTQDVSSGIDVRSFQEGNAVELMDVQINPMSLVENKGCL
jgi:hypothetical protein